LIIDNSVQGGAPSDMAEAVVVDPNILE
jgi:hypothetical protein